MGSPISGMCKAAAGRELGTSVGVEAGAAHDFPGFWLI